MLFALAVTIVAQPMGPPFQYDLSSTCYDVEDDDRLQGGLTAVRVLSDVASGRLDRSVVTTLSAMVDAYELAHDSCSSTDFSGLPALGSAIDDREDAMMRGAYAGVLAQLRGDAKYLHHVQPIRIQMQAWLTEMLQESLTCRATAKTGGDASACESALQDDVNQSAAYFVAWIQGSAPYWATQGDSIDSDTAQVASDQAQVTQLMTQSKNERDSVDQQLWPQMLDLQNQAQTAVADRDWCRAMADAYAAQGDFATADSYMYWYGYYDHQFVTLTTQIIPALSAQMQALEADAYNCDGQVATLQSAIQSLAQQTNIRTQKLVSGVP